jgi:hypothetical protein
MKRDDLNEKRQRDASHISTWTKRQMTDTNGDLLEAYTLLNEEEERDGQHKCLSPIRV